MLKARQSVRREFVAETERVRENPFMIDPIDDVVILRRSIGVNSAPRHTGRRIHSVNYPGSFNVDLRERRTHPRDLGIVAVDRRLEFCGSFSKLNNAFDRANFLCPE
jgi:hypothetical protein